MTIDERLAAPVERHEALAQSVEILTRVVQEMQAAMQAAMQAEQAARAEMDTRERRGRVAVLRRIEAYLRALNGGGEDGG